MNGTAAASRLPGEHTGHVDGVKVTQPPAILADYLHLTPLLAGGTGFSFAEQAQHFFDFLLRAVTAEAGRSGRIHTDIIFGE